jgi:iron complex transport system ATP-binding protein
MVLAQNTPLLLLDEPTAFLDIRVQLELMQLLGALARQGKTVLLAIHDLPLALAHCKEILVLHEGQICGRDRLEAAFQIQIDERGNALCLGNSTCPRG